MTEPDRTDLQDSTAPTATTEPAPAAPTAETRGPLVAPREPGPIGLSPDSGTLAYLMPDAAGALRLWLHPLDGEPRELAIDVELIEDRDGPQWSPDGASLALTGMREGRTAIWLVSVESGDARLLIDHPAADHSPRWSPDGATIAFVSRRGGRDAIAICVAQPNSVAPATQLTTALPGQDDREPVWSKTGDRIAFCRRTLEGTDLQLTDHIWSVTVATGETKQLTKKGAIRHSLRWGPERPLIVHVTEDAEWDQLAVVNADNSAGWTLASEAGDKADPRWSLDGARVLYTRAQGGVVRCCDRATSAASSALLDPGDGVASSPRWLPDKRVVYAFTAPGQPVRFMTQENTADAERTELPVVDWQQGQDLVAPNTLEIETGAGTKLSGFFYRRPEGSGPAPVVLSLPERPDITATARFHATEQALASSGLAVYAPILPGMRGLGRTIANSLRDQSESEAEVSDLADIVATLRETDGVDAERVAIVGRGFGATLALVLAGARPGSVQAIVAIDPIADWTLEFDQADDAWRAWLTKMYGLPVARPGRYALRTPATFVGVIDAPLLLLGTETAPAHRATQLDQLTATLDELGVAYTRETAPATEWETAARAATFLRQAFRPEAPAPAPPDDAEATATVTATTTATTAEEPAAFPPDAPEANGDPMAATETVSTDAR